VKLRFASQLQSLPTSLRAYLPNILAMKKITTAPNTPPPASM
jgi:hypothetical protein